MRLCYRARWSDDEEQGTHWVDYPKTSDPDAEVFDRVRRSDLAALPAFFGRATNRPLSLSYRGGLRALVDDSDETDFPAALDALANDVQHLAGKLADSEQLVSALRSVIEPVAPALGIDLDKLADMVTFVPAGVALGALLRALKPTLQLDGEDLALPLSRHGSTAAAVLAAAELLAHGRDSDGVVVIDDFGENVDAPTAMHLAATLRRQTGQAWLSTRRSEVAEAFRAEELVRLTLDESGRRTPHKGQRPSTKAERTAARHIALQLLPVMAARGVVVLEGPHDKAGLRAVAERRLRKNVALPASRGVALIDAGAADASGGSSATPRVSSAARHLGFFAVTVIDGDPDDDAVVQANLEAADAVIRLPDGTAIELALLDGLDDDAIRKALRRLPVQLPADFDDIDQRHLYRLAVKSLKSGGGLHAQFVDAIPRGKVPKLASRILDEATRCIVARDSGLQQL